MSSLQAVALEPNRLSEAQLALLKKKIGAHGNAIVNGGTTDKEAGFKLGILFLMDILREGWGSPNQ